VWSYNGAFGPPVPPRFPAATRSTGFMTAVLGGGVGVGFESVVVGRMIGLALAW
jgi:hypothetical protein